MKKIALALFTFLLTAVGSFAEEKPAIWQNPPPTTVSDEATRLSYMEKVLGINRASWSCRVPKGYKVIFLLHQVGEKKPQWELIYEGNKLSQPVIPDLFIASAPDLTSTESQMFSFGSSRGVSSLYLRKKGGMRIHFSDVKPEVKSTLFEVYAPSENKTPQIWCEVEFVKTP